jgi:low affinity Fe/Cu permease
VLNCLRQNVVRREPKGRPSAISREVAVAKNRHEDGHARYLVHSNAKPADLRRVGHYRSTPKARRVAVRRLRALLPQKRLRERESAVGAKGCLGKRSFSPPQHREPEQEAAAILYEKMNEKAVKGADQTPRSFRCKVNDLFRAFSRNTASAVGSAWAFVIAITVIIVWAATGSMFHSSDTWQLIINTGTTIVTFLMVFLIQNTQNRDGKAIQLKLDELIRALKGARNKLVDLEDLSDEELKKLEKEFQRLHTRSQETDTQVGKT